MQVQEEEPPLKLPSLTALPSQITSPVVEDEPPDEESVFDDESATELEELSAGEEVFLHPPRNRQQDKIPIAKMRCIYLFCM